MKFRFTHKKDKPLFEKEDDIQENQDKPIANGINPKSEKLSLQEIITRGKEDRKTKSLSYSFRFLKFLIVIILILVIIDAVERHFSIENQLLSEVFELLKYATTTVMGYLFARKEIE